MDERYGKRKNSTNYLGERHVLSILKELGIEVPTETSTRFQIYCPFHHNIHTTSATVDKGNGFFYCFGAGCRLKMNIVEFVGKVQGIGYFPSLRFINNLKSEDIVVEPTEEKEAEDLVPYSTSALKYFQDNFWESKRAKDYVKGRGIRKASAETFGLGYDPKVKLGTGEVVDMVVTPMFDKDGICIGVIKRSIDGKAFKNSYNLPSSKSMFGIHIAKAQNCDEVVICESNFDAILSHQSGHPAVATLGGIFSEYHLTQISRYFNKVVIAVDVDEEGELFAQKIGKMCKKRGLYTYRIQYSQYEALPHGAKDFGECKSDEEIAQAVRFAVPMSFD